MAALRILGRDSKADDISELSEIDASTVNYIFKTFVTEFCEAFASEYIKMPSGTELLKTMEVYRILGMPGAVGSMDCTHIRLARCP